MTTQDQLELEPADRAAVDAIVATLVHHLHREHPRPSRKDPALRDAHPKHHGCVHARFEVKRGLPEDLAQGVFARPATYEAWVRFSNAFKIRHDLERDARGMAIKVLGVSGVGHEEATQDFLLVTHKVFFARTPSDFVDFPAAVAGAGSPLGLITRVVGFFFGLRPFRFKWREFIALQRSLNWCTSPLVRTYFSQTPYRYGISTAKFRARPQQRGRPHQWIWLWIQVVLFQLSWIHRFKFDRWRDALHRALLRDLRKYPAAFDFQVQRREDGTPPDDAVAVWSSRRWPYETVATLRIDPLPDLSQADIETMMAFGQHLSYTPWHHTAGHEPLGSINKARRMVYDAVSSLRHQLNHVRRREPRPGESPREYLRDTESQPAHATAHD
jgi:hypothetical protein